jgi:hypothetical protein
MHMKALVSRPWPPLDIVRSTSEEGRWGRAFAAASIWSVLRIALGAWHKGEVGLSA